MNQQYADATSTVTGAVTGTDKLTVAGALTAGSAASLSDNTARALGYGAMSTNALSVTATKVTPATSALASSSLTSTTAAINAGYAIANEQTLINGATVSATAGPNGSDAMYYLSTLSAANSTLANDRNAVITAGYGNQASNAIALAIGTTATSGATYANLASVGNVQNNAAAITSTITPSLALVDTVVTTTLTNSAITSSNNTLLAQANGNRAASNSLAVTGTSLILEDGSSGTVSPVVGTMSYTSSTGTEVAQAALTVQSLQASATGTVAASIGGTVPGVRTTVSGALTDSSVLALTNTETASANANLAYNTLSIATTTLQTTAGVQGVQTSAGAVTAGLGTSGSPTGTTIALGSTVSDGTVKITGNTGNSSALGNVTTNALTASATSLAGDGKVLFAVAGDIGTLLPGTTSDLGVANYQAATGTETATVYELFTVTGASTVANSTISVLSNTNIAEAADNRATNSVALTGGVTAALTSALGNWQTSTGVTNSTISTTDLVAITGAVTASTIKTDSNAGYGYALGNQATNSLSSTNTTFTGQSLANPIAGDMGSANGAKADLALANTQIGVTGGTETTSVTNVFKVTGASTLGTSTVSASSNVSYGEAVDNRAVNTLALTSTTLTNASTALSNNQTSASKTSTTVDGTAWVANTGAITDSTIKVDSNSGTASSVSNVATNYATVTATYLTGTTIAANAGTVGSDVRASGDFVVNNTQSTTTIKF